MLELLIQRLPITRSVSPGGPGAAWCLLDNHPGKIDLDCETGVGDEDRRGGGPEPPDSADAMVTAEVRGRRRETSVADNTPVEADTRIK